MDQNELSFAEGDLQPITGINIQVCKHTSYFAMGGWCQWWVCATPGIPPSRAQISSGMGHMYPTLARCTPRPESTTSKQHVYKLLKICYGYTCVQEDILVPTHYKGTNIKPSIYSELMPWPEIPLTCHIFERFCGKFMNLLGLTENTVLAVLLFVLEFDQVLVYALGVCVPQKEEEL